MRRTTAFLFSLPLAASLMACNPPPEEPLDTGNNGSETVAPAIPEADIGDVPEATEVPEATDVPAPAPDEASAAQCGADQLGDFINVLPSTDILDKIKERIGDKQIRVINPGDAVTMDFRPDRLNAETGEDGRIKQFRCY